MRSIAQYLLIGLMQCIFVAPGQSQPARSSDAPASSGILRAVLASAALPSVVDKPRHFKIVQVRLPAKQTAAYLGGIGFVFAMSGTVEIIAGVEHQLLSKGDGLLVPAGTKISFKAGSTGPAIFLHFVLLTVEELGQPMEGLPAVVTPLYATNSPIPGLKSGPYEFTLARTTIPPRLPANPLHRRSGAAVYFVQSGTGMFTAGGKSEPRPTGAIQYEPYNLVHQWGNPGNVPLVIIQANISQEGVPAVIFVNDEVSGAAK
jgi:mannose-6-phosphate isomerase-like protein (cupin superfamily)